MTGTSLPRVPEGLRDLMKVFTKDVLREKPENLYQFSANYFDGIVSEKTPQAMRKYEPVQSYEAIMKNRIRQQVPLSLVFNIIPETLTELIKQFIKAVLKECPENIYVFAREYFHRLSIAKTTQNNRNTDYTTYEKYLEGKENARLAPKVTCECGRVLSAARTLEAIPLNEQNAQSSPLIIDKDNQQHERSYSVNYLRAVCIIQKHFRQYLKRKNATKKYNSHEYVTAIYIIQRQVRRYLTRRRIANSKSLDQQQSKKNIRQHYDSATYMRAVYVIQRHYRLYRKRQNKKQLKNDTVSLTAAAFIIQRTFRRLIKARRAKKHTAAALDQGDEVNDNASEAGSYTSASTALLSTESAGEHMEFGGNFEESVHQQTIKEDEEVENNYVNFDEKHFEETTKKDGQSINSKMWEEKIEDEIDEPTVAKEIEDNIQEPSNEKAPIIKIEQTEETTEDDIDESTVAKMENIVEEAILAKMTINRLSNKDEQIHEKDESIEEVQIVVHERPIDTESLKPKTESDESLIERESRTKDQFIASVDEPSIEIEGTAAIRELVNEFLINEIQYSTQEQSQPNEVQEEPCIKKTASITNLSESLESIKSRETKQNESSDVMLGENLAHGESMDLDTFATDTLDKATLKLLKPERTIEKMSQRQVSESLDKDNLPTEASFEEPIIKSMGSLQDQANMDIEDGDLIIYKRLQREDTRESSAQSDSVVFGETNEEEAERQGSANKIDAEPTRVQFTRHYTIAGDDPRRMFKTIDDDGEGDFEAAPLIDSTSSFCLDDETSEAIRKKIMAYSLSETDSDYFDPNKVITDDSYIDTAMADDAMGTSTETESTIVSAATKIQAGARGFLTRRRLRRASAGTKSSTQETKASFGNDAISESLERFIEEEAAKKIQAAYRIHTRKQNRRKNKLEGVSLESSLAARRQKLQRGDALRNDSTPDDDNSARTSINTTNGPQVEKISKKHRSEATAEEHKKSKVSMELKWPVLRQNSMPVQIDCEVLRVIPKHLRKRIRSAESQKKNRK
ncbi:uncharacterized protein Dwil_GK13388 [Drosophila willistoni]|uniref:RIIa domain-containing protein n=1 Tax=Drosophila willistoni TaxID=7260 RepID=B4NJY5_DROWI|nr:uncharacterized protein Dwil_GK13388 [Drosophila willistoni]